MCVKKYFFKTLNIQLLSDAEDTDKQEVTDMIKKKITFSPSAVTGNTTNENLDNSNKNIAAKDDDDDKAAELCHDINDDDDYDDMDNNEIITVEDPMEMNEDICADMIDRKQKLISIEPIVSEEDKQSDCVDGPSAIETQLVENEPVIVAQDIQSVDTVEIEAVQLEEDHLSPGTSGGDSEGAWLHIDSEPSMLEENKLTEKEIEVENTLEDKKTDCLAMEIREEPKIYTDSCETCLIVNEERTNASDSKDEVSPFGHVKPRRTYRDQPSLAATDTFSVLCNASGTTIQNNIGLDTEVQESVVEESEKMQPFNLHDVVLSNVRNVENGSHIAMDGSTMVSCSAMEDVGDISEQDDVLTTSSREQSADEAIEVEDDVSPEDSVSNEGGTRRVVNFEEEESGSNYRVLPNDDLIGQVVEEEGSSSESSAPSISPAINDLMEGVETVAVFRQQNNVTVTDYDVPVENYHDPKDDESVKDLRSKNDQERQDGNSSTLMFTYSDDNDADDSPLHIEEADAAGRVQEEPSETEESSLLSASEQREVESLETVREEDNGDDSRNDESVNNTIQDIEAENRSESNTDEERSSNKIASEDIEEGNDEEIEKTVVDKESSLLLDDDDIELEKADSTLSVAGSSRLPEIETPIDDDSMSTCSSVGSSKTGRRKRKRIYEKSDRVTRSSSRGVSPPSGSTQPTKKIIMQKFMEENRICEEEAVSAEDIDKATREKLKKEEDIDEGASGISNSGSTRRLRSTSSATTPRKSSTPKVIYN